MADEDAGCVQIKRDANLSGVYYVVLNRAKRLNSLDMGMFDGLSAAAKQLTAQKDVRCVILVGEGKSFCAGLDILGAMNRPAHFNKLFKQRSFLSTASSAPNDPTPQILEEQAVALPQVSVNLAQELGVSWRYIPAPVICVVQGQCLGGGLQIALGCDFRFVHPAAKLSIMESRWGIIPDMGITLSLRELVPIDVAKDLAMTGRVLTGEQAKHIGLATRVCEDPLAEAQAYARELCERSPDTNAATKFLFQRTWRAPENQALAIETRLQTKLMLSYNQIAMALRSLKLLRLPFANRTIASSV